MDMVLQPLWNHISSSLKFRKSKPSSRCHSHEADASWLPFWPPSFCLQQQFSQCFHFHCLVQTESFGCMSNDQISCHFRHLDELQKSTALLPSDCRYFHCIIPSASILLLAAFFSEICFLCIQLSHLAIPGAASWVLHTHEAFHPQSIWNS